MIDGPEPYDGVCSDLELTRRAAVDEVVTAGDCCSVEFWVRRGAIRGCCLGYASQKPYYLEYRTH